MRVLLRNIEAVTCKGFNIAASSNLLMELAGERPYLGKTLSELVICSCDTVGLVGLSRGGSVDDGKVSVLRPLVAFVFLSRFII